MTNLAQSPSFSPTKIASTSTINAFDIFLNTILIPIYYFSIPAILTTFFAPYKKTAFVDKNPGLSTKLNNLVTNIISRLIGVIIRFLIVIIGVFSFLLFLPIGLILATISILPPISYLIFKKITPDDIQTQETTTIGEFFTLLIKSNFFKFFISKTNLPVEIFTSLLTDNTTLTTIDPELLKKGLKEKLALLYQKYPPYKDILEKVHLTDTDLLNIGTWYELANPVRSPIILSRKKVQSLNGLGHDLAYGYTINLDRFSKNLLTLETKDVKVLGRSTEIAQIETTLSSSRNSNIIIVGEAGVGKHTIAIELARRISRGISPNTLIHKRVLEIDFHSILSQGANHEDSKVLVGKILEEAQEAGNIILVIDDLDQFVSSQDGRTDISEIIIKSAESNKIQIIAMTNQALYDKYVLSHPSLAKNFSKIIIKPLSVPETIKVLITSAEKLQRDQKITFNYFGIKDIVQKSDTYIHTSPLPEKAIDVTFELISYVKNNNLGNTLTPEVINQYLTQKIGTNIGKLTEDKSETLKNLESILHQNIIGQDEAVLAVSRALRRRSLQVSNTKKPIGTFLFLGPTGVGKTQTAKILSKEYFGNQDYVLRLDMSQFQDSTAVEKLIGSNITNQPGILTTQLQTKPNAVLLLDELEKAHPKILNLLLTILDEGYITDGFGREVKAQNTIIIATSNAGAQLIAELVKTQTPYQTLHDSLLEHIKQENIFSPEFINRFDEVIIFHPLTQENLKEIVKLNLTELNNRLKNEKNITINISEALINYIVEKGYDPAFGARNIIRFIQDFVEDSVAKTLLDNPEVTGEITIEIPSST